MIGRLTTVFVLAISISGCANITEQNPIIDAKMSDMTNYGADLSECRTLASQLNAGDSIIKTSAIGAFTGAAIGAVVGVFDSKRGFGKSVATGGAGGAVTGGIKGGLDTFEDRKEIVAKCMDGRGYAVLMR